VVFETRIFITSFGHKAKFLCAKTHLIIKLNKLILTHVFATGGCMLIGYVRVSTDEQTTKMQEDALSKMGCEKIFKDVASGAIDQRPGLIESLNFARPGDCIVVWRLDRLGRSLRHLIETVNQLNERGIAFKSLNENIDTYTAGGKLVFHIFGALAEFERELIRSRTKAGLEAAKIRGRIGGRPRIESQAINALIKDKALISSDLKGLVKELGISRSTFYRRLKFKAELDRI
jgi:DNA invertase Pin-like site-specific DNA recombinase